MRQLAFLTFIILAACSTTGVRDGGGAYWQNQTWDGKLLDSMQSTLHYPLNATGQPVQPVPSEVRATVSFTYADDKILDPKIIESSGRADLDAAFLAQVATANPPSAYGSHAAESHAFELALEMPTPMEALEHSLAEAINAKKQYPKRAILDGVQGVNLVEFDYSDTKAANVTVYKSSGDKSLDEASLRAISNAQLPPPPIWLTSRPIRLRMSICYSLGNSTNCPYSQRAIEVVNPPAVDQAPSPPSGP
ncbi:MAG TPA: energy transducer TonB [Gammaproteobacteria bacterium]|jgi:TonB family protein